MKNTYFLVIAFLFSGFAFSQVDIHYDSDPGTMINGTTQNIQVDYYGYNIYMHATNTSGAAANWKFRRIILNSSATFSDQLCDNNLCFSCSGNDYTTPSPVAVPAGDSSLFKPVLNFLDGGTATIRYIILDADNSDAPIDSVDFAINSSVGIEEIDISLSAYPNPASDDFFINFSGNEGMNFNVVMYNVLGEEVMRRTVVNGVNKLNVADLNNGVYFYSITNNNEIIETKKLIVKH